MLMNKCVFCKIANGSVPSAKIWEDKDFIAFLDIYPNTEGMTLVMPKKHYSSYIFDAPDSVVSKLMKAVKKVSKMLERAFETKRVAVVNEGMGVNHLHVKLYPLHGVNKNFNPTESKDQIFFEKYEGYVSTMLGPRKDTEYLSKLAQEIIEKNNEKKTFHSN